MFDPVRLSRRAKTTSNFTRAWPATQRESRRKSQVFASRGDRFLLLSFAIPGLLVLLTFHYLPLAGNAIAFQDYAPFLGIRHSNWVGLNNFRILFDGDPRFLNAVKNTLLLTLIQAVLVFPAPLGLALLVNSLMSDTIKRVVQSITYLPHFLSWVVVVAIFQSTLGGAGPLSNLLRQHGGDGLHIIGNAHIFFAVVTSQVVWKDSGWAAILFFAALTQIPVELYESSAVDGATRGRQLWHVTLPGIRPTIILLFILQLGNSLSVGFEQLLLQQQAVGIHASEVIDTYVYNEGITGGAWGVATAVGLVKGVIGLALVLAANRVAHLFGEDGIYQR